MNSLTEKVLARIALGIEYDGSGYFGWQRQQEVVSVQQKIEEAASRVANQLITIFCAGRTDAGVHATGQVIHFDSDAERGLKAWTMGMNTNLPDNIAVTWAKNVADDFHARFSATSRRYRYIINNTQLRGAILSQGVTHYHRELNVDAMHQAAQCLIGEQDFTSFRAALCQSNSPFRNVTFVQVKRAGKYVIVEIEANAFLHHMVRNIVGALCEIGANRQPIEWIAELLELKDRTRCAATAKPNGLYLVKVTYPEHFQLPEQPLGPIFLPEQL